MCPVMGSCHYCSVDQRRGTQCSLKGSGWSVFVVQQCICPPAKHRCCLYTKPARYAKHTKHATMLGQLLLESMLNWNTGKKRCRCTVARAAGVTAGTGQRVQLGGADEVPGQLAVALVGDSLGKVAWVLQTLQCDPRAMYKLSSFQLSQLQFLSREICTLGSSFCC